ncbi:hypothetical protein [Carp edema virus]|nr:hypothetical protein [Carp edema virus]
MTSLFIDSFCLDISKIDITNDAARDMVDSAIYLNMKKLKKLQTEMEKVKNEIDKYEHTIRRDKLRVSRENHFLRYQFDSNNVRFDKILRDVVESNPLEDLKNVITVEYFLDWYCKLSYIPSFFRGILMGLDIFPNQVIFHLINIDPHKDKTHSAYSYTKGDNEIFRVNFESHGVKSSYTRYSEIRKDNFVLMSPVVEEFLEDIVNNTFGAEVKLVPSRERKVGIRIRLSDSEFSYSIA